MKFQVSAYKGCSMAGYRSFYYEDLAEAKDKRAELLACLPDGYEVHIKRVEA